MCVWGWPCHSDHFRLGKTDNVRAGWDAWVMNITLSVTLKPSCLHCDGGTTSQPPDVTGCITVRSHPSSKSVPWLLNKRSNAVMPETSDSCYRMNPELLTAAGIMHENTVLQWICPLNKSTFILFRVISSLKKIYSLFPIIYSMKWGKAVFT